MKLTTPNPNEFEFIYDSWARSYRISPWAGCIPNHLYDNVIRQSFGEILDRGARVLMGVTEDDDRRVIGYSVSEPSHKVLHWLYVKRDFRGTGLRRGAALLEATCTPGNWLYTFRTNASSGFLHLKGCTFKHDATPARVKWRG